MSGPAERARRRVGVEFDCELLDRLNAQVRTMNADGSGVTRNGIIEAAVAGIVREFEDIDSGLPAGEAARDRAQRGG